MSSQTDIGLWKYMVKGCQNEKKIKLDPGHLSVPQTQIFAILHFKMAKIGHFQLNERDLLCNKINLILFLSDNLCAKQ